MSNPERASYLRNILPCDPGYPEAVAEAMRRFPDKAEPTAEAVGSDLASAGHLAIDLGQRLQAGALHLARERTIDGERIGVESYQAEYAARVLTDLRQLMAESGGQVQGSGR